MEIQRLKSANLQKKDSADESIASWIHYFGSEGTKNVKERRAEYGMYFMKIKS